MTVPVSELLFSDLIGDWPREPRLSEWMLVPQEDINHFGRVTKDPDRNHIDPDRVASGEPQRCAGPPLDDPGAVQLVPAL